MMEQKFVVGYLQACASGKLTFSECIPILEVGVTAALLIAAVVLLIVVRMESRVDDQAERDAAGAR